MFSYSHKIKFHQIDAAGIIFFAEILRVAHDAYESFLEYLTFDPQYIFEEGYLIPIVHAEADYKLPIVLSDKLEINLSVKKIGKTSFHIGYEFLNQKCQTVAVATTVHAFIKKECKTPVAIPEDFRSSLENLSHDEKSNQVF